MLLKSFTSGTLKIKAYLTRKEMGEAAGKDAAAYLRELLARKKEIYVVFAAAPSQNEFLETLCAEKDIDWTRVHALHMDEYVGLPDDAPQCFGNFLRKAIFDRLPFASVDYISTNPISAQAVADYDAILKEHHLDVVFFGIGENGHLAFNDPHVADFNDPLLVKKVDIDATCRQQQVNDGCFSRLSEVPEYAITMTIPELISCDKAFIVVPAATKVNAVRATVQDPISEKVPATILRCHPDATLYVDAESGKYIL